MRSTAIALGLLAALCLPAIAEVLEHQSYDATALPSEVGWRFNANGDESLCWLQEGVLHMDTMGQPHFSPSSIANYHRPFRVPQGEPETITVHMRARVLEIEAAGSWRTSFALTVDWTRPDGSGDLFGFAIAPAHIYRWYNGRSIADLDATQWHDYNMVCDLVYGLMTVIVDGDTVGTYEVDPGQGFQRVFFGDMMLNANAHAEVAELEFVVEGEPGAPVAAATLTSIRHLFD